MGRPTLRAAGPDDTDRVAALVRTCFPDNPKGDPDVLRWQYWQNPFGDAVSWLLEDDDDLVAHFAVVCLPAKIDGREALVGKTADAATLTAWRGRGLMGDVANACIAECARRQVAVMISFPNEKSYGPQRRIGIRDIGEAVAFVRPLDDGWFARQLHAPTALARRLGRGWFGPTGSGGRELNHPPDALDALLARALPADYTGVVRDRAFWEWRTVRRPRGAYRYFGYEADGRLAGFAVTTLRTAYGAQVVHLLDIVAEDDAAAAATVGAALADPGDADLAATLTFPGSPVALAARAGGLRRLPRAVAPKRQPVSMFLPDPKRTDLLKRRWALAWADLDHL